VLSSASAQAARTRSDGVADLLKLITEDSLTATIQR
jgi:hypothetical protein